MRGSSTLTVGASWERLLAGVTVGGLRSAVLAAQAPGRTGFASWSIRWLVDLDSERAMGKKRELESLLSKEIV
eukprot:8888371-Lingulodinium_polyedra.AAC.1